MTASSTLADLLAAEGASDPRAEYLALTTAAGVVPLAGRTVLSIAGADRAKVLNNLCTNDIKSLAEGRGCETFLTNVKGHVVGFLTVHATADALVVETSPGQAEKVLPHIDRYVIREQVELADLSPDRVVLHAMGPEAGARLTGILGREILESLTAGETMSTRSVTLGEHRLMLVRYDLRGTRDAEAAGFRLICPAESAGEVWRALRTSGFSACGQASFEAVRIRARFPEFGRDITDEQLPQEVDRDRLAISFKKGCYLGQETVARIDALGHVNKKLVRLRWEGAAAAPPAGLELTLDGKPAGQVTSAALVPGESAALALAYVRKGASGTRYASAAGEAVVL
jgi:tRNA-modifying protein YgfZ